MSFLRLDRGHTVAALAALALLLVMALDWYTTDQGEGLRRDEAIIGEQDVPDALQFEFDQLEESASIAAEEEEQTAWAASGLLDRVILALLLTSVGLALAAAALRAAGRRYEPPLTPSLLAAAAAAAAALLVAVRIVQEGAVEPGGAVGAGAPLGLVALAALAVGSVMASRAEREAEREPDRGRARATA